jgi:hypothetical protein
MVSVCLSAISLVLSAIILSTMMGAISILSFRLSEHTFQLTQFHT